MLALWIAKGVIAAASVMLLAIRAPHGRRSRHVAIAKDRKGRWDVTVLGDRKDQRPLTTNH